MHRKLARFQYAHSRAPKRALKKIPKKGGAGRERVTISRMLRKRSMPTAAAPAPAPKKMRTVSPKTGPASGRSAPDRSTRAAHAGSEHGHTCEGRESVGPREHTFRRVDELEEEDAGRKPAAGHATQHVARLGGCLRVVAEDTGPSAAHPLLAGMPRNEGDHHAGAGNHVPKSGKKVAAPTTPPWRP